MRSLNCDVCRKDLDEGVVSRDYFHICEYDVCEACKDAIDARLKPSVRTHFPYSQDWYEHEFMSRLEKSVSTGRA